MKRFLGALIIVITFASFSTASDAFVLLDTNVVKEGGIIKIKIFCEKPLRAAEIEFNGNTYSAFFKQFDIKENYFIFNSIIPVKLGTSGRKNLTIKYLLQNGGERETKEKIKVKAMMEKKVEINTGQVNDEFNSQLKTDGKAIYSVQGPITPIKYNFPFIMPVTATVSGGFGDSRNYDNGQGQWRHKGIDLAAKKGTPVHADNNGTIVGAFSTKTYGNTVILDHGAGIYSLFFHLSKVYVKKGAVVSKGDIIATVGDSGLSTGPHLHWQICVFKTPVNPMEFLTDF